MAAKVRSVDFLPEIFQTPVNKQFLSATLDQLIQEPQYKQTQGFIGQKTGPGVNPNDYYVIEPTPSRNNYQLEPGVIMLDPTTGKINDAITYPGMLDAIRTQGGIIDQADRLFESEYYTWDPLLDFDKFSNYAQYYWLPGGPQVVTVAPTTVPTQETFTVTRTNGAYTFTGYAGSNPALTLARNGNYQFVIAQNNATSVDYRVINNNTSGWIVDYDRNPTLTLIRGNTYTWDLVQSLPLKFYIKTELSYGTTNLWNTGVTNNGATEGLVTFTVPQDAPDTLYYCNNVEYNLRGQLNIIDAIPGDGPEFWIQSEPGVNGTLSWSPNISSRDVLGVTNNGIDLGTVEFDVPSVNAQDFYYALPYIGYPTADTGKIDLICSTILYDQINGISVNQFLNKYPTGIDGVTELNNRTLVFTTQTSDPEPGGWYNVTPFDPLASGDDFTAGAYDTTSFAEATPIADPAIQFSLWQINYVSDANGVLFMQLTSILPIDNLTQFIVGYGKEYVNTQWYKNAQGYFQEMPLLTATKNVLYYQDSEDPKIFGEIKLVEENLAAYINVDTEILGKLNYSSPNGVTFTNGLKVIFEGSVYPESYQGNTYYVYGVGTGITLSLESNFVVPETYANELSVPYDSTPFDSTGYDADLNEPLVADYVTINMASLDLNPWSRSNRWFHIDVINAAAAYNKTTTNLRYATRGVRPILEFRAGTRLFNFGTQGIPAVNIIDQTQTDALLNVNGQISYGIDGYNLVQGSTVIFAADDNVDVRNTVYTVNFIVVDPSTSDVPVINLEPTNYSPVLANQTTVCMDGLTVKGVSFYFNGDYWYETQQKTSVQQAPLFDVYNSSGYSFGNKTQYPSTNFLGCKLLSYAENPDNPVDEVLGIPLSFFSINNIGDILFDNNLYTDTFVYTPVSAGVTVDVSSGFVRQYADRLTFTTEIGWQPAAIPSLQRQQFQFTYSGTSLQLDILAETNLDVPPVQVFVNSEYQLPSSYTLSVNANTNTTLITLNSNSIAVGDLVDVLAYSQQVSTQGFYQVPINLENNPFNGNSSQFTLGGVRSHYGTICQNLVDLEGVINGPNNTRDLGNIGIYGQQIVQESSPLTLAGFFLRSENYDIFSSIEYNSREYVRYKNKLLNAVTQISIEPGQSISSILDKSIQYVTASLTSSNSFYWSDMLPCGTNYTSTVTTVNPITGKTFNLNQTYNFTSSNYQGLLVYVNDVLLLRGTEYIVSTDAPKLTINIQLTVGDVVTINEYIPVVTNNVSTNPSPNWCPNTPSKMGLYPKYTPEIFLDETYSEPTVVIQGHDGSITIAFGDIRDQVLLEFEKRIFDNIKVDDNPIPLTTDEVDPSFYPAQTTALLPGFFRKTPYTYAEINQILSEDFLTWVGQNKLDYTTQDYVASNPFTYNYSQAANRIDGKPFLQGNWRGIYRYFYDTETPNTTPWEMLGFTQEPNYWIGRYGPAPYTSGNTVLWDDLEAGLVADPAAPYILPEYVRSGLSKIIPASSEGELLTPLECVVGLNDPYGFRQSWVAGDGGPVQASWWNSSSYPFAIMRMLALTKPAQFFSLFADRDLYRYNTTLGQYLYNDRYRLGVSGSNGIKVYGDGVSKASYINWIVDYKQQTGVNSTTALTTALENLDVRLCYRMAAFSDPVYVQLSTERAGPNATNNTLVIPPSSYNLLFYKNQPFNSITYSAVVVQVEQLGTGGIGYSVYGYSTVQPYFEIQDSSPAGLYQTITAGDVSVQVPSQYTKNINQIPYGHVFTNISSVCDFLLSYGTFLTNQGLIFDNQENGYTLNWKQMAEQFLYFAGQGWTPGTIINLNPCATTIKSSQPISIVDTIASVTPENMLLDQNRQVLDVRKMVVNRDGNEFSITSTNGQYINYLTLKYTNYEDMIVVDNTSQYQDLIYDPTTGARQCRLSLVASTTTDWDGQLNAQGFILNLNNIQQWSKNNTYTKGEIVLYQNTYYQALEIVQPATAFNYTNWVKSDYQAIDTGLLPNLANKADQLTTAYDVYQANLTSDNDLFAFALIGFRPRDYMTQMNLNGSTQIQLYQQFLGTKGTLKAAEIFNNSRFNGKESGAYDIYENWGVLSGTYGASANKSYFEIQLNEALLKYNPSTAQIIVPGQTSQADQPVYLDNLWKESYNITTPDILPTTYENSSLPSALPSAGYVCLDDVDVTVFSIDDPTNIDADINNIGIGTNIWIAKINPYNWGAYRVATIPGQMTSLTSNLDGTSIAQFSADTGLVYGDLVVIKYFNDAINGVYRVLAAPTPTTIRIAYDFANSNVNNVTGTGLGFHLQSARVSQASDIATLPFVNDLIPGAKVWADDDGNGHWVTYEKQAPFVTNSVLGEGITAQGQYGVSIAQTQNNLGALIGAPGADNGAGKVLAYYGGIYIDYQLSSELVLGTTDTVGYGGAIVIGNNTWAVAGASGSYSGMGYAVVIYRDTNTGKYVQSQLLVPPDQDFSAIGFGTSTAISSDERWMYIGAPAGNKVYAYELIKVEEQSISYATDGLTQIYNYSSAIQINYLYPAQLIVKLNEITLTLNVDYTIDQNYIIFNQLYTTGYTVTIIRNLDAQLDVQTYIGLAQNSIVGTGTGAVFNVTATRGSYSPELVGSGSNYSVGDILTINGSQLGGTTPSDNLYITVTSITNTSGILGFSYTGDGSATTTVFALDTYLYNATTIYNFSVTVNGALQRPFLDYTFNNSTTNLTFIAVPPLGAEIIVTTPTYYQYVETISATNSLTGDNFGASVATTTDGRQIMVGAPNRTVNALSNAGSTYVFDRSSIRYIVSNTSTLTYTVPGNVVQPIAVIVNGEYLLNISQSVAGQYTVSGNNVIFSNIVFNYGDTIEIETNQISLIQQFNSNTVSNGGKYASSLVCSSLDASLFAGAPYDSTYLQEAGSVDYQLNQSRVYGVTSSTIANPTISASGTLRINDIVITVPTQPNNTIAGVVAAINDANIPNVAASVTPNLSFTGDGVTKVFYIGSLYTNTTSYTTVVYVNGILQQYNTVYSYDPETESIYFVYAPSTGYNIVVVSGRLTISIINSAAAEDYNRLTVLPGPVNSVFNQLGFNTFVFTQQLLSPSPTATAQFGASISIDAKAASLIVGAPNGNVYEPNTFDDGQTYFDEHSTRFFNSVPNSGVAYTYDYFPSSSSSISNPGQFAFGQQIYNSNIQQGYRFATAVNYTNGILLAGAPGGVPTNTTNYGFITAFNNIGSKTAWYPIRTQQPVVDVYAIDGVFSYNGSQAVGINDTVNGAYQTYYDFFDPLQGKILGVARQNIDYIGAVDPAQYNNGAVHNNGNSWGPERIGQMWWDTDTVRFIDPNQDDIQYASRRWGTTFPGSSVDIYQWIESSTPPSGYTGQGTPLSIVSFTTKSQLGQNNIFTTMYYFWVRGITTIAADSGKTLSSSGISSYILDPRSSGLPYIAGLNASTIAIYNATNLINATNTILSIGFDRQITDAVVHQEYQMITDGIADSFLNTQLYRKFLDSLCGQNTAGNQVPDPTLSLGMRYGVQFRPRQSMFADRFTALENYLGRANTVLSQFPISETRSFALLKSSEPTPTSTVTVNGVTTVVWNYEVPNLEVLSYQDLNLVPVGYKYLVLSDSDQDGRWTIYEVIAGPATQLIQVQNYDTTLYWYYINWYLPGYNSSIAPVAAVQNSGQLDALSLKTAPIGSSVRVVNNGAGKWEIYVRNTINSWTRVGLEDGTIAFKEELWNYNVGNFGFGSEVFDAQYFDETPQIETRYILRALNEQIYIEDLLMERNSSLILMFNYAYSEFTNPEWLVKTSYVDVNHKIRSLLPYQTYLQDDQDFVLNYFKEVKPYHVQVRKFNLIYSGEDDFAGDLTDFDLPAYWDINLDIPQFVSPILTPYDTAITPSYSIESDTASNSQLWLAPSLYSEWYNNYLMSIESAIVVNGGYGYTTPPVVTVTGTSATPATMTATINSAGRVNAMTVVNPGSGWVTTPVITISGGGLPGVTIEWEPGLAVNSNTYIKSELNIFRVDVAGTLGNISPAGAVTQLNGTITLIYVATQAQATAQLGNGLVRSFKTTLKYDRYQYATSILDWTAYNFIIVNLDSATVTGGIATLTFATPETTVPYPVGSSISVAGVSNSQYNGTYVVTACTIDTVSYASTATTSGTGGQITANVLVVYASGTQVRYNGAVWEANSDISGTVFDPSEWTQVNAGDLSGVDRTMGYYIGTPNTPGLNLPLLVDGIDYPGVLVSGISFEYDTGFDRAPYDVTTYDNLLYSPDGRLTYDKGVLDTFYESDYIDPYLGKRPADINVSGGAYIDTYESHAPEELVPGIEFDTLDLRVYTTPGADWKGLGHGFPQSLFQVIYDSSNPTVSFAAQFPYPFALEITDATQDANLTLGIDYTVDWPNLTFTILSSSTIVQSNDQLSVYVYELGGGNQVYKNVYNGADVGNTLTVPVAYYHAGSTTPAIQEFVIFVNGVYLSNAYYTYVEGTAYGTTTITFDNTYTATDFLSLVAIEPTTIDNVTTDYSWSLPVIEKIISDGSSTYTLTSNLEYTNSVNAIITVDGNRVKSAAGIDYVANGTTTLFLVPQRLGVDQSTISDNEVFVYFNDILQSSTLYTLFPASEGTTIEFTAPPTTGIRIYIAVTTGAQAVIDATTSTLTFTGFTPLADQIILVTTFNDTREQRLLTQVFVGPVSTGITVAQGFDTTNFDPLFIPATVFVEPKVLLTADQIEKGLAYYINVVGTTDFTLVGASSNVSGTTFIAEWGSTNSVTAATPTGLFFCYQTSKMYVGQTVTVSGTLTGTATISGYTDPTTYYIIATDGESQFTLSLTSAGLPIVTTPGSTTGLTFTLNNPLSGDGNVYEIEYVRDDTTNSFNNTSGSFNFTSIQSVNINDFDLTRLTDDIGRPWVSLNGRPLTPYVEYTIEGTQLILYSGVIGPTDVLMVTQVTNSVVPESMSFRIFQDMREVQATYVITPKTTTTLAQAVAITDDIIYVTNASALITPNFAINSWGIITINGERIMYREIDQDNNTVSGLLRGTAGTGIATHDIGSLVYSMGRNSILPTEFQNYIVSNTFAADGTTTVFTAPKVSLEFNNAVTYVPNISYSQGTIVINAGFYYRALITITTNISINNTFYWQPLSRAVEVLVGGILQTSGYTVTAEAPVTVTFANPPADGSDVTIFVRRADTWYQQGVNPASASNGVPLQETNTVPALFLRGLN